MMQSVEVTKPALVGRRLTPLAVAIVAYLRVITFYRRSNSIDPLAGQRPLWSGADI